MKLFKYASMMLAMLAAVSFVSCGDDEDEEGSENGTNISVNKKNLYGVWEPIYCKFLEVYEGKKESEEGKITNGWPEYLDENDRDEGYSEDDGSFFRLEFLENGGLNFYYYMKGQWYLCDDIDPYHYKVSGNILTQIDDDGDQFPCDITKLDNTTLVLEETYNEPSYKYWQQITYKKIK